jgi:hypothetical protein
MIYRSIFNTT